MAEPRTNEELGELRCFGCGQEPRSGVVVRLADGSNCPSCAARVLEEQPTLLRQPTAESPASVDTSSDAVLGAPSSEAVVHGAAVTPSAALGARHRLRHLSGGTAPDMHVAPDGHWPNEPA